MTMTIRQDLERRSYSAQLAARATTEPAAVATVIVAPDGDERRVTVGELESRCNRAAWHLMRSGVGPQSLVVVALPNGATHLAATLAAWRLGACVLPMNPRLPAVEQRAILEVAGTWRPTFVVAPDDAVGRVDATSSELETAQDEGRIPDRVPHPGKAIGSGGSTGRPKIIVDPAPWTRAPGDFSNIAPVDVRAGEVQLVTGQLYHNTAFSLAHRGLFDEHRLILLEKFDAELALELIERHRVSFMACVPTVLQRMAKSPSFAARDLRSVRSIYYTGGFAPDWMRIAWFDKVPPERHFEAYGAAENFGKCVIRGDEWLEHRGSVGRPVATELRVLDEELRPVGTGEIGEIYLRRLDLDSTFFYVGSRPPRSTPDGLMTAGDLGYLDADGYLHLVDRRVDMIVTGGSNVYCAEVEQAITSHPDVLDAAVIGLPDPDWGRRVHAVVETRPGLTAPSQSELDRHTRRLLASYKVPKTWEFVDRLPRDESGKLRRTAMVDARAGEQRAGGQGAAGQGSAPTGRGAGRR